MENSITKAKKSRHVRTSKSIDTRKRITEVDILRKAYEIYIENSDFSSNEIDHLFRIERELGESHNLGSSVGYPPSGKRCIQL
jgi:hypothetical protein